MSFWIEKPIFLELSMPRKPRTSSAKGKLFSFLLIFHTEACKWTYKWKQANLLIFILKYVSSSDKVFSQISVFFFFFCLQSGYSFQKNVLQVKSLLIGLALCLFLFSLWFISIEYIFIQLIQNIHKNSYKLKYLKFWISKLNFAYR